MLYWDEKRLTDTQIRLYIIKIEVKTGCDIIWGYIDGIVVPIARPKITNQNLHYSGYYRGHVIKYQAIITPDCLFLSVYAVLSSIQSIQFGGQN